MIKTILKYITGVQRAKNLHSLQTLQCSLFSAEAKLQESGEQKEREKKLKILALEVDVLRQEGRKAPDPALLKPQHWEYLLGLTSRSARKKYFQYLWQNEKKSENRVVGVIFKQKYIPYLTNPLITNILR